MTPFFDSPEKIATLQRVAASWLGTPFMPNAAVRGSGVCCHKLAGALMVECGHLPPGTEIPSGPMDWSNANTNSLLGAWLDARPDFVAMARESMAGPLPGDILGFKLGGCVQHLGVVVHENGQFVHCFRGQPVCYANIADASFFQRLSQIWRPIITHHALRII